MTTRNQVDVGLSGQTGSASFVGSVSPTITTPIIMQINDGNGNAMLQNSATASAINNVQFSNAATGNNPTIAAIGSNSNIVLDLRKKGTSGVQVQGRSTNSNAPAGYIGEFMNSTIPLGSAIALTTNVVSNITSLNLTAGDWNTWGAVAFVADTLTSITGLRGAVNTTSATLPGVLSTSTAQTIMNYASLVAGAVTFAFPVQEGRFILSTTTTVYLMVRGNFTGSTLSAYGFFSARRND